MQVRKLTLDEVTIAIAIEEEHEAPDFDDAESLAWIEKRRAQGYLEAWCCLKVTASWNGFSASEYLGGCSYDLGKRTVLEVFTEVATEHGMQDEALAALNAKIAEQVATLAPLIAEAP